LLAAATEISEATRALELVLDERETRNREDTAMTNLMNALDLNQHSVVSVPLAEADAAGPASLAAYDTVMGAAVPTSAYQVFNGRLSALPLYGNFTSKGGTLMLMFSGTGNVANVVPGSTYILGVILNIDGRDVGQATMWVVDTNAKTLSTTLVVTGIPSGSHRVAITNFKNTVVNLSYNTWNLAVLEI
jgi:hypothetical protein